MINKLKYISYLNQIKSNDINPKLEYIYDINEIESYEKLTGKTIGMIENQSFFNIIFPLVKQKGKDSEPFIYPMISYPGSHGGAAALITATNGNEDSEKFILFVKQIRITNENKVSIEIPRGFADKFKDRTALATVLREVEEETNICVDKISSVTPLGDMQVDSGLSNNNVSLFHIEIFSNNINEIKLSSNDDTEGVIGYAWYNEAQIFDLIKKNAITDSFTLCALLKYLINSL